MKVDRTADPYLVDPQALMKWIEDCLQAITQGKLAKALQVDPATIHRWKNGQAKRLYHEQIEAIALFQETSFEEALESLGAKLFQPTIKVQEQEDANSVYIPLYSVSDGAGKGSVSSFEKVKSLLKFPRDWMKEIFPGQPFEQFEAVKVVGDSMPPLRPGDWVMHNPKDVAIRDGVFVICIDRELWVKRLSRLPGGRVRVSSDNPIYPAIELAQNEVEVIGKVVYAGVQYGG
jgi:phage repressor protein C with HTH and peptisase S24 domain